jgi:hypothetical protein
MHGHTFSEGLDHASEIAAFCDLLANTPISVNDGIRSEYGDTIGYEWAKEWLKRRSLKDLVVEVEPVALPVTLCRLLRQHYGYDAICPMDRHFLKTAAGVKPKPRVLVSHNDRHFRVKPPRRESMERLLATQADIEIRYIDGCVV